MHERRRGVVGLVVVAVCLSGSTAPRAQPAAPPPAGAAAGRLDEGFRLVSQGQLDAADAIFAELLAAATRQENRGLEGEARRGIASVHYARREFAASRDEMERALAIFAEMGHQGRCAALNNSLGSLAFELGDRASAQHHWRAALDAYRAVGNDRQQASLLYNLAFVVPEVQEREALVAEGIRLARNAGDPRLEGQLHHALGDARLSAGDYAGALRALDTAVDLLERAGEPARGSLARALTSVGRLYRAHGRRDEAIECYRGALSIQESLRDWQGMAQSHNALGVSLGALGRLREAARELESAVAIATEHLPAPVVAFYRVNLALILVRNGEAARGLALLEADRSVPVDDEVARLAALTGALRALGRTKEALDAATAAIDRARDRGFSDRLPWLLATRADVRWQLSGAGDGLPDALEAVSIVEQARRTAVPIDVLKQGFDLEQSAPYSTAVVLLFEAGQREAALEMAERGRARAFADLLATRIGDEIPERAPRPRLAALAGLEPSPTNTALAPTATTQELRALAGRLSSTLLAYWVAADATLIWTIAPDGTLHAARSAATAARLATLAERSAATDGTGDALRELDRLLIGPVRAWLPAAAGSRVTVVPHGPLFRVSFAALRDASGRYLVERFALNYAPSGAVLALATSPRTATPGEADRPGLFRGAPAGRHLLLADPAPVLTLEDGRRLPRLPAARDEVRAIANLTGTQGVVSLMGEDATEEALLREAATSTVVHFATHAVVRDDRPFESFLALAPAPAKPKPREPGSQPAGPAGSRPPPGTDGRLTVAEIYDFPPGADLVVLSACATAVGPPSGDGLTGLARAFFSTGTSAVVATLWDVADEPSARLVAAFYRSLRQQPDRSRALRAAQLRLLADLRAGRVTAGTAAGRVALPEHPSLWAGFVLFGHP